jgi:hypothetical protein
VARYENARAQDGHLHGDDDREKGHNEHEAKEVVKEALPHAGHDKVELNEHRAERQDACRRIEDVWIRCSRVVRNVPRDLICARRPHYQRRLCGQVATDIRQRDGDNKPDGYKRKVHGHRNGAGRAGGGDKDVEQRERQHNNPCMPANLQR